MPKHMDGSTLFYALFSLTMGAAALELILYVHMKSTTTRVVRVFFMVMLYFALSAIFGGLMLLNPTEELAILYSRIAGFCYVMSSASLLHFVVILAKGEEKKAGFNTSVFFWLFLIIAFMTGLVMDSVEYIGDGYVFHGAGLTLMISVTSALIVVMMMVLIQKFRTSLDAEQRKQYILLMFAAFSPIIIGGGIIALSMIGFDVPEATYPLESVGVLIALSYAIYRYHLIIVRPVKESVRNVELQKQNIPPPILISGRSFIIESKRSQIAYQMLIEEINKGAQGLIITREHPERIREQYGLEKTPVIWLTNALGHDNIDPSNITIIQRAISDFIRGGERPVVLFDGIETLILNNKVDRVLQMIFNLRDEFFFSKGTLLLSIDPMTVEERVLAMLEKDLEVLSDEQNAQYAN